MLGTPEATYSRNLIGDPCQRGPGKPVAPPVPDGEALAGPRTGRHAVCRAFPRKRLLSAGAVLGAAEMSDRDANVKYMFEHKQPGAGPGATVPAARPAPDPDPDLAAPVPLERLEAQICELAGHVAAATCRFLVLLADFDARRGWASWEMTSCAAWLSWKCQLTAGTAREHVRVARALPDLPVIRAEFAAGRLSYAKVRALTRIATPATEAGLAEIAGPMTGNQLERFARARRQVSHADDDQARVRRRLTWRLEDDGSLAGTFRLPPLAGAVLLQALRAATADPEHPRDGQDASVSAETPAGEAPAVCEAAPVHRRGYLIASAPGGAFTFRRPDGTVLPASPAPPDLDGTINDCHDAGITPATIIPAWYGERLDLDYAIHACFANAGYQARQRDQASHQPGQAATAAPAPGQEPWRPIATEVDLIAGIQQLCQKYALS